MDTVWTLRQGPPLRWKEWGGPSVLFHPASGDVHLLEPAARQALLSLREGPADAATLAGRVAAALGCEADADALAEGLAALLPELDRLGLVERV